MVILYYPIMQGHSRSTYIVLYNLWYESAICACGFEFTRQANFSLLDLRNLQEQVKKAFC